MREIIYKYNPRGLYQTEDNTSFSNDSHLKIIVQAHNFSLAIGGETLSSSSFGGCVAIVSNKGDVVFFDNESNIIAKVSEDDRSYREVRVDWEQNFISILFGFVDVVDNYPNCDGEYDRWDKVWVTERSVTLNTEDNSVKIEHRQ